MNDTETKEELQKNLKVIYRSLREEIKDAIFAPATSDAYDNIKVKYELTDKQREELSIQTGLLLMGLHAPQELVPALSTHMGITREKASFIAQELNRDIFNPIKDALKEMQGEVGGILPPKPVAPIPSPVGATSQKAQLPPKSPFPFSVSKALGNIPATSTPAVPSSAPAGATGNIFEDKLSGAFRVKSDAVEYAATGSAPSKPRPMVPHKPTLVTPPIPTPTTPTPDPYRELPH